MTFDLRLMRRGMRPATMERIKMPHGLKEDLGELAIDVFTAASNAGQTFQEALLAVYLTGLENGQAATTEKSSVAAAMIAPRQS